MNPVFQLITKNDGCILIGRMVMFKRPYVVDEGETLLFLLTGLGHLLCCQNFAKFVKVN